MWNLARIATSSLVALCIGLSVVVIAVTAIGILSTRSATDLGRQVASNELGTSTATGELARNMDTAYVTGDKVSVCDVRGTVLFSIPVPSEVEV